MGYYPVKIRPTDRNFSRYIRRNGICEMYSMYGIECSPKLECAHYHGRGKESTRFDTENAYCLCFNHHKKTHENKSIFTEFMKNKLGKESYALLELKSNTTKKRDDKMDKIIISSLLERVGLKWN